MKRSYKKVIRDLGDKVEVEHKNNFNIKINKGGFKELKENDWVEYSFVEKNGKLDFNSLRILDMVESINKIYKGVIYSIDNPELFEEIPKEKIVALFKFSGLTINKLRQYYQSVLSLYNAYERKKNINVNELKTEFNLLLAKINYDVNRKNSKVPKEIYDFVKYNKEKVFEDNDIKSVKERLKIFKKHFETVVAYSVGELSDR